MPVIHSLPLHRVEKMQFFRQAPVYLMPTLETYFTFLDQVWLRQKYNAHQVRPDWGSNSCPPNHDSMTVTETPALTTWPSVASSYMYTSKEHNHRYLLFSYLEMMFPGIQFAAVCINLFSDEQITFMPSALKPKYLSDMNILLIMPWVCSSSKSTKGKAVFPY